MTCENALKFLWGVKLKSVSRRGHRRVYGVGFNQWAVRDRDRQSAVGYSRDKEAWDGDPLTESPHCDRSCSPGALSSHCPGALLTSRSPGARHSQSCLWGLARHPMTCGTQNRRKHYWIGPCSSCQNEKESLSSGLELPPVVNTRMGLHITGPVSRTLSCRLRETVTLLWSLLERIDLPSPTTTRASHLPRVLLVFGRFLTTRSGHLRPRHRKWLNWQVRDRTERSLTISSYFLASQILMSTRVIPGSC